MVPARWPLASWIAAALVALASSAVPVARGQEPLVLMEAPLGVETEGPVYANRLPFDRRLQPSAQQRPEEPPRPGWPERIWAIARGRVQLEGGYGFVSDSGSDVRLSQHTLPDLLLRVGLTERLELRVGWPGLLWTDRDSPDDSRTSQQVLDPNVGFMFDLCQQQGWLPQTAVLAAVPISREGNPFAMGSLQPLSQFLYCWYLGERWTLGGTTGMALFRVEGDNFTQLQQVVNLDYVLTERLSTFAEWEMLVDYGSESDGTQHLLGGGLSLLLTDRTWLVWQAGAGLNERAPDLVTNVRVAVRF